MAVALPWIVLVVSGMLEAVWATALARSDGLTRFLPAALFVVAIVMSLSGLAYAMRSIPTGTAYAVWVAIGAALTVAVGLVSGEEAVSLLKIVFLVGIVACVIGLKLVSD